MNTQPATFDLARALTASRINWARIVSEGHDLAQIANEAGQYGDFDLARKALRAAKRLGR